MKYFQPCTAECPCGKGSHAYTHNLRPSLIKAFRKFVDKWNVRRKPTHCLDLNFTHNQLCTWQILKHWGIIRQLSGREGLYDVTPLGVDFYNGLAQVNDVVAVMNDKRIPDDHEAWLTHKKKPKKVFIWQVDHSAQPVSRNHFVQECTRQTSIFASL